MKFLARFILLFIVSITVQAAFTPLPPTPTRPDTITVKGNLLTSDGASETILPVSGTDGYLLTEDSTLPNGIGFKEPPVSTTLTTKGDLQGFDGSDNVRIPVSGTDGYLLIEDSTEPNGVAFKDPTTMVFSVAQAEIYGRLQWVTASSCQWQIAKTNTTFVNSPIDSDCTNPTIEEGVIANDGDKSLHFIMPENSPVGTYVIDMGLPLANSFLSGNSTCKSRFKSTNIETSTQEIYVSNEDNTFSNTRYTFKIDSPLTSDEKLYWQARSNTSASGNCSVRSDLAEMKQEISVTYYPPSSTIVRQNQVADASNVNEFNVVLTNSGSAYSVIYSDIPVLDTFPVNTSSAFTATFLSGIFTVPPMVRCTTNSQAGLTAEALTYNVTASQFQFQAYNFSGGGQASTPITCTIKKMVPDFNKSLMVYGQFEQIKSGDVATSYALNSLGFTVTASTEPIPFVIAEDNKSGWSQVGSHGLDSYTAPSTGTYDVSGVITVTANQDDWQIIAYVNGALVTPLGYQRGAVSSPINTYSGKIKLQKDDVLTIRTNRTVTLSTTMGYNTVYVHQLVDTESLVKNLNDNNNVKCQTKFLSANTSAIGDIADLTFNNLTIGKRYRMHLQARSGTSGQVQVIHNGVVLANAYSSAASFSNSASTGTFSATTTTISSYKANAVLSNGDGTKNQTWAELCELPDNYIETTEF